MKKSSRNYIVLAVAGFCLIVMGGIIASIGFFNNGSFAVEKSQYGLLSFPKWSSGNETASSNFTTSDTNIDTIKINGSVADLNIMRGDALRMETYNMPEGSVITNKENNVLNLNFKEKWRISFFNFGNDNRKIDMYVPENVKIINADMSVGDIRLNGLTLDSLKIKCNVGELQASDIIANTVDLGVNTGDLVYKGNFKTRMDINSNVGDVDIVLPDEYNSYDYDVATNVGGLDVANRSTSGVSNKYTQTNGAGRLLRARSDIGDLEISYN